MGRWNARVLCCVEQACAASTSSSTALAQAQAASRRGNSASILQIGRFLQFEIGVIAILSRRRLHHASSIQFVVTFSAIPPYCCIVVLRPGLVVALCAGIFPVTLFVDHLNSNSSPCFRRTFLLQQHLVENLPYLSLRLVTALLDLFISDSTDVSCFPSFEAVDRILNFACCELWNWHELLRHFFFVFSALLSLFFNVVFFAFVVIGQFCVEFCKHVCDAVSCGDGFACS